MKNVKLLIIGMGVMLSLQLFAAQSPNTPMALPATFFSTKNFNYSGTVAHNPEVGSTGRWNSICRWQVIASRPAGQLGDGLWISPGGGFMLTFPANNTTTNSVCGNRHVFLRYNYYESTNFDTQKITGGIDNDGDYHNAGGTFGLLGWYNPSPSIIFNFANRPATAFSSKIYFAPLFGITQEVNIRFDPTAPIVYTGAGLIGGEFKDTNNWILPNYSFDLSGSLVSFYGRLDKNKKIRVEVQDLESPSTPSNIAGSGVWQAYAVYDFDNPPNNDPLNNSTIPADANTLPATVAASTTRLFNGCIFNNATTLTARVAAGETNSYVSGQCGSAFTYPSVGYAIGSTTGFEFEFDLNWGNVNGASIKAKGRYAEGSHKIGLRFFDMAGNAGTSFTSFNIDNNAPCEIAAHNCSLSINSIYDAYTKGAPPTNNPIVNLAFFASDGSGSGVENMQIISYYNGTTSPNVTTISIPMGNFGYCNNAGVTTHATKVTCSGSGGTWIDNSSRVGYYTTGAATYIDGTTSQFSNEVVSNIVNFPISSLPTPSQGYYTFCARYKDKVGNITSISNATNETTNSWAYLSRNSSNNDEITGNVIWNDSGGNALLPNQEYGNNTVCSFINLDSFSPGAPQDLVLKEASTSAVLSTAQATGYFSDMSGPGRMIHTGAATVDDHPVPSGATVWSNQATIDLEFNLPSNPVPGTALVKLKYYFTGNYAPPAILNQGFEDSMGTAVNMATGTCSNTTYVTKLTCEESSGLWTPTVGKITHTLVYDAVNQQDGCKNLYIWLGDEAGNFITKDPSFYNDFYHSGVLFCFDDQLPGKVGIATDTLNSQDPSFPGSGTTPGIIKLYDYELLKTATTAFDDITLFDPSKTNDIANADRSQNVKNINITKTRDASNNLYTIGQEGYRLTIAWVPVIDKDDPNGGNNSGLNTTTPYKLCWGTTIGVCTLFKDIPIAGTDFTNGSVENYKVYTLSVAEMTNLTSGVWYFSVITYDNANNSVTSSPVSIIIDNTYPCWTDPSPTDIANNIGNGYHRGKSGSISCAITSTNHVDSIDFATASQALKDQGGLTAFASVFHSSIIGYFKCGDNTSEACDDPNDHSSLTPVPKMGGVVASFVLGPVDNNNGSDFDTNISIPTPNNVQFGVGLAVFSQCSRETVYWIPSDHQLLASNHFIGDNNVGFQFHLFERHPNITAITNVGTEDCNNGVNLDRDAVGFYSYYKANPPRWYNPATGSYNVTHWDNDNAITAAVNIKRIRFTQNDGREVLRNVYMRIKDIAGNWSPFAIDSDVGIVKQSVIVDTKPPDRMWVEANSGSSPEIQKQSDGTFLMGMRDDNDDGITEYYNPINDPIGNSRTDIKDIKFIPTNEPTFKVKIVRPLDFSTVAKGAYKFDSAPTAVTDTSGSFTPDGGGFFNIAASVNFQTVYVWLEDKMANPTTVAVPLIDNYYTQGVFCDFTSTTNLYPDPDVGGPLEGGANTACKIIRFQLPYDGTSPIWTAVTPLTAGTIAPIPYIDKYYVAGIEALNTRTPNFHFFPAVDNIAGHCNLGTCSNVAYTNNRTSCLADGSTWTNSGSSENLCISGGGTWTALESGLRKESIDGGGNSSYKICIDQSPPPACSVSYLANNDTLATAVVLDSFNNPTGANAYQYPIPVNLLDGNWFMSVLAYDRAGNISSSSPTRQILIDLAPPCTTANGDSCSLTAKSASIPVNRQFSTSEIDGGVKLDIIAQDFHSGVADFQMGEYYYDTATGQCVMRLLSYSNLKYRMRRTNTGLMAGTLDNENTGATIATKRTTTTQVSCDGSTLFGYCSNTAFLNSAACTAAGAEWFTSSIDFAVVGAVNKTDSNLTNDSILPFPSGSTALSIPFNSGNVIEGFLLTNLQDGAFPRDGKKTLQIRFRDNGGNWSRPISEEIVYDKMPPPAPKAISAVPATWTRLDTITVYIDLPDVTTTPGVTIDHSSQGPDPFGIDNIYFKVGTAPASPTNGTPVKITDAINNPVIGRYGFNYTALVTGEKRIYVWLEDVVLNKDHNNQTFIDVYVDIDKPTSPGAPVSQVGFSSYLPKFIWTVALDQTAGVGLFDSALHNATDSVENLPVLATYKLCWDLVAGQCTNFTWVNNINEYTFPIGDELNAGNWYFMVYAYDGVGNRSPASAITGISVVPSIPTLGYLGYGKYFETTLLPNAGIKMGEEGKYTFKVLYTEGNNRAPEVTSKHLQLDLNGNGVYDSNESFEMIKASGLTGTIFDVDYSDASYINGEMYTITVDLPFVAKTFGKLSYRFKFRTAGLEAAKDASTTFDPTIDHFVEIDRYATDEVSVVEVRNNIQRPNSRLPVVVMIQPPKDPSTKISAVILNRHGKLVKKLINNIPYSQMERDYVYWDTTSHTNRPVASGLYYLYVRIANREAMEKIVVVR